MCCICYVRTNLTTSLRIRYRAGGTQQKKKLNSIRIQLWYWSIKKGYYCCSTDKGVENSWSRTINAISLDSPFSFPWEQGWCFLNFNIIPLRSLSRCNFALGKTDVWVSACILACQSRRIYGADCTIVLSDQVRHALAAEDPSESLRCLILNVTKLTS